MSLTIHATKDNDMVFGFETHDETILAPDADALADVGADPFIPNPDYVEGAGFSMSEGNFMQLLDALGLERQTRIFDAQMILDACDEYLTLKVSIEREDYFGRRAIQLHTVAKVGLAAGCDEVVAA